MTGQLLTFTERWWRRHDRTDVRTNGNKGAVDYRAFEMEVPIDLI